jgi:hypothetical protein
MERMHRFIPFLLLGASAFGQTGEPQTEKPPAYIEQAVRARVNEIYTLWKAEQYRKAESLVAEDTKDYYYSGSKPIIKSFEVLDVQYFDDFKIAKVFTKVVEPVVIAGFPPGEMTVKMPTLWRFEDGNWYLFEDRTRMTAAGGIQSKIQAAVEAATAGAGVDVTAASGMPKDLPQTPDFAMGKLTPDKKEVEISAGTTQEVHISNSSPGTMELELGAPLKGIAAKLDHAEVARGGQAVLTLSAGKEPVGGVFYLRVLPTNEVIQIRVGVKP